MIMKPLREIWSSNVEKELHNISKLVSTPFASYIAIDTEFPGFINPTPIDAAISENQRYDTMKHNIDTTKLIQLGFTFYSEKGKQAFSWQVNFKEFDPAVDGHVHSSIELLKQSGVDFERNKRDGVDARLFVKLFLDKLVVPCRDKSKWLTFHGMYDLGYVVKLLTGMPLPDTLPEFMFRVQRLVGDVYDVKYIAKLCGFGERIGLIRLAKELGVEQGGPAHQAGYDSMVTGSVYWRLKEKFSFDDNEFVGVLVGAEELGLVNLRQREYMRALIAAYCGTPSPGNASSYCHCPVAL